MPLGTVNDRQGSGTLKYSLVLGFISLNEKQSEPIHGDSYVNRSRFLTKVITPGKIRPPVLGGQRQTSCQYVISTHATLLTCLAPQCTGGV